MINPNWPTLLYEWGPHWNCNGAAQPLDRYAEVSAQTRGRTAMQRGKQYELDQVRSGTMSMQLRNGTGQFDPLNPSGPWYGHIMPYQPARARAQWPPTVQLLTQVQATGGDLGGYSPGIIPQGQQGISVFSSTDSTGGSIVASGTAWQGANVFQFAVPAATAAGQLPCWTPQVPMELGTTYSQQMRVRCITPGVTLQVQATIRSHDTGGNLIATAAGSTVSLVGSTSAGWTQITVSGTPAAMAAYMGCAVQLPVTSPGAAATLQVDGWQVEKAAAPSTWVTPGVWYPMWSGFVERWPSAWTHSGTYGTVSPTAVDTLSLLSQRLLRAPLTEEIYIRNPRFLFTLDDPQGSSSFTDTIGAYPAAPLAVSKYGSGSLVSGTQITAANPVTGTYTGSTGTVATVANPFPGTNIIAGATYISLGNSGITGPSSPGSWTRMIAFRYTGPTPTSGNNACLWSSMDGQTNQAGSHIFAQITDSGNPVVLIQGPTGVGNTYAASGATNVVDGNWHLLLFGYSAASGTIFVSQDGVLTFVYPSVPAATTPTGLRSDNVGGFVDYSVGNGTIYNFQGDLSFVCEWPTYFGSADITAVYTAWKNSFVGDSSNARYQRILGWAGFSGPTNIQTGLTTSMGPAATDGQDALTALQEVVDTENGEHFVDRAGAVTFQSRAARYNALTPMFIFGENAGGGEIPYEEVASEMDPTRLANQIAVTQASSGQVFSAQDATSIANNFPRQLTRTVNSSSAQECQDAANYLLSRYKTAAVRVSALRLHPSSNPAVMWPVCLALELGMRIRVMRRPPNQPAFAVDCFVENISWDLGDDGNAWVTLQCAPVDATPYAIFAAFHTTLFSTISSGVSTITIAPGQDNVNPAAAQIGQGQRLVLGQNTANQETVTVLSVGTTTAGWTSATITLQAATTKSHTAGDLVCEPLPAGVTDPTTWDASSKFDSVAFAY